MEVFGVFLAQKGALMVIESPAQAWVGRVLEVHNCVHFVIEQTVLINLRRLVGQAGEYELSVWIAPGFVKAAKERGRCGAIEAMVVIEDSHPHGFAPINIGKPSSLPQL